MPHCVSSLVKRGALLCAAAVPLALLSGCAMTSSGPSDSTIAEVSGVVHGGARALLQTHGAGHLGLGADEANAGSLADFGEIGVLAEETVAWMNGFYIGDFGGADDGRDIQITT